MLRTLVLLIFSLFFLNFFAKPVFAVSNCKDLGIDWSPKVFLESPTDTNLTFTISDANTLNTLKDNSVYLLIDKSHILTSGSAAPAVVITSNTFTYGLGGEQLSKNNHNGSLRWLPKGKSDYEDFCSNVDYQVGSVGACTWDPSVPSKIPPNSKLTIKFVGKAGAEYQLKTIEGLGGSTLAKATTDSNGQGVFSDILIPGSNGDTKKLNIISFAAGTQSCQKQITIESTAAPPAAAPPGPVIPITRPPTATYVVPVAIPCTGSTCTTGGGETCPDDGRGPAIKTAIGCIHTNPSEFVADFMKFAIGISGGLAFLMMLLGAFQMITSSGNPDSLNNGRTRLTSAIIGLLFVIFATLLMQIIGVDILFKGFAGFNR